MNGSAKYIIRHLQGSENHLLREFLYEAIYIPEGVWSQTVKGKWSVQYGYVL